MAFSAELYSAPAHWASYLINGDASSSDLTEQDIADADAMVAEIGCGAPVSCEDFDFRHHGDYGREAGNYCDYIFLREESTEGQ